MTAQTQVRVRSVSGPADEAAWSQYVQAHPHATVFHLRAWSDAVADSYGHEPMHLAAWDGDRMVGLLPLFRVDSMFVGPVLVSLPYATYGGVLADSHDAAAALVRFAQRLRDLTRCNYLELRHRDPVGLALPLIDRYDTFRNRLPDRAGDVLGGLPRKARAAARKGLDLLGDDAASCDPDHLDAIYDLYARTMRRLGSPNYRADFFRMLQANYGDRCVCTLVSKADRPMAGVISFIFRDEIVPYFSGCADEGMKLCANNVMYLKLMEWAVTRGLRKFDFNRTRRDNRGPYDFKRHHGFEPTPLHYQISIRSSDGVAARPDLTPSNRKFAMAARLWRKLPLSLTRPAGERVTRWIP